MHVINERIDYTKEWGSKEVRLFTGNPIIKADGSVVMGAGAAKQVRDFYSGIDKEFGKRLKKDRRANIIIIRVNTKMIGWVKVKRHWAESADLRLVQESMIELARMANNFHDFTFRINYPAIGNGRTDIKLVEPLLQVLPDNVIVHK